MLVLSRKPDEKIVFPNLGVTLTLLGVRGRVAKIGIEAPEDLPILRQEIADAEHDIAQEPYLPREVRHELRNRLHAIKLAVHLFQRQMEAGLVDQAQSTLLKLVHDLNGLDGRLEKPTASPAPPVGDTAACQALVVDDDANERELLAGFLRLSGWGVATAGDGLEALDYLGSHPLPDFVLLDMRMPRCNGARTIDLIRSNPELEDLTVFAISGSSPDEYGISIGPQGVNRWFPKPLDPAALLQEMTHAGAA